MNDQISRRRALVMGAAAGASLLLARGAKAEEARRKVIVWSEGTAPKKVYPDDIRGAVAEGLKPLEGWEIVTATIGDPDQGVPEESLGKTDVLIWWGHQRHNDVKNQTVDRIVKHVKEDGMGFIALHSSHYSKALKRLLGTPCGWKGGYIEDGSDLKMIVKAPDHPIAKGIKDFDIPHTERYGEPFECPEPQTVVFDGLFTLPSGQTQQSRQGLVWEVGKGRVFYFQPGHETYPIFFQDEVRQVMRNAVQWCAPQRA